MKAHPLAEGEFEGAVIEPPPTGRQARDQLAILVELAEVLEDVKRNRDPILGVLVHDTQFLTWRWDLFPPTGVTPSEGDKHEDDAADDEFLHSCPSLSSRAKVSIAVTV